MSKFSSSSALDSIHRSWASRAPLSELRSTVPAAGSRLCAGHGLARARESSCPPPTARGSPRSDAVALATPRRATYGRHLDDGPAPASRATPRPCRSPRATHAEPAPTAASLADRPRSQDRRSTRRSKRLQLPATRPYAVIIGIGTHPWRWPCRDWDDRTASEWSVCLAVLRPCGSEH